MIDESKNFLFDISEDADNSESFQVPDWAVFVGIYFPDCTDANFGLEVSLDDSTFVPIVDVATGQDVVIVASTFDPCYVDISDFVRAVPRDAYVRVTSSTSQLTADKTLTLFCRG